MSPKRCMIGKTVWTEERRAKCRGKDCGKVIIWATRNDKYHPFDVDTLRSHYATCPNAKKYRKRES